MRTTPASLAVAFVLVAAVGGTPQATLAADRVLLVGVGRYALPGSDLPGIDLDLQMMRDASLLLGFPADAIKVLQDHEATAANVDAALRSWVVDGVGPDDHVMVYFSAHGAQIPDDNGDEADGRDEVIVLHDTKVVRENGRATLASVLVDDRLGTLLAGVPSRKLLVIVDTCHSGTSTRSFPVSTRALGVADGVAKTLVYPGMVKAAPGAGGDWLEGKAAGAIIAIGAARDDETAMATRQGSLFTLGLHRTLGEADAARRALTPNALVQAATAFIRAEVPAARAHRPQLTASAAAADRPLRMRSATVGAGVQRARLRALVERISARLPLVANRDTFRVGEDMVLSMDLASDGYLNVVTVGPDDAVTVLFPNGFQKENRVGRGRFELPTEAMPFVLRASPPVGPVYVAAFLTSEPLDLRATGFGEDRAAFRTLSPSGTRDMAVVGRKPTASVAAGQLHVTVEP